MMMMSLGPCVTPYGIGAMCHTIWSLGPCVTPYGMMMMSLGPCVTPYGIMTMMSLGAWFVIPIEACCRTSLSLGAWFVIPIEACGETSTSLSLGRWNDDDELEGMVCQ